jgi:hypothetical protein
MRMIFLTKLKTAAATAAVLLTLAGGVGPGLVPAAAQDAKADSAAARAAPAGPKAPDDAAFLDRICVEFRGSKATPVEHVYFAADADAGKRHKVTRWLLADPAAKAHLGGKAEAGTRADDVFVFTDHGADVKRFTVTTKDAAATEVQTVREWVDVGADPKRIDSYYRTVRLAAAADDRAPADRKTVVVRDGMDGTARLEVLLDAEAPPDAKKAEPAPAAPVRVRVLTADKDGKEYRVVMVGEDGKQFRLSVPALGDGPAAGKTPPAEGYLVELYSRLPDGKKTDGKEPAPTLWAAQPPGGTADRAVTVWDVSPSIDTDAAFLHRAVAEARGTPPTTIEERYFAADPDPRKREKLLDALLSDPAAARRVGEAWKRRMLAPPAAGRSTTDLVLPYNPKAVAPGDYRLVVPYTGGQPKPAGVQPYLFVQPKGKVEVVPYPAPAKDVLIPKGTTPPVPPKPPAAVFPPTPVEPAPRATARLVVGSPSADRWQRLVADLITVGKTDEQILEALTLAAAARLPTDVEKRLTLATIPAAADRAAAWSAVARALAGPTATPAPTPLALPKP